MPLGYTGKILRVNLTDLSYEILEKSEYFYRTFMGGSAMASFVLLTEMEAGVDPLGPDNVLVVTTSVLTGTPLAGANRYTVAAKSPLSEGFGESEAGGYFSVNLKKAGFDVVAIFDIDPNLVGKTYRGIQVYHTDEIGKVAKKNDIQIAIVAVPKEAAKEAIKKVIDAGIKGILNFTEVRVPIPEGFFLKNVNLLGELESITYYMVNPDRVCRCYQPVKR